MAKLLILYEACLKDIRHTYVEEAHEVNALWLENPGMFKRLCKLTWCLVWWLSCACLYRCKKYSAL